MPPSLQGGVDVGTINKTNNFALKYEVEFEIINLKSMLYRWIKKFTMYIDI